MNTYNNILNKIEKYPYVSFDVWDTLIFRSTKHPMEQRKFIAILAKERFQLEVENYYEQRYISENIARAKFQGNEVNLEMIYAEMPYTDDVKKKLMDIECEVEISNCVENPLMIQLLNRCLDNGKKIVITTDMFLPRLAVEKILHKLDITYDYLFLSSEVGVTKNSGKLFPIVLKQIQISPLDIIHIGDNPISDIKRAEECNIAAIKINTKRSSFKPYFPYLNYGIDDYANNHLNSLLELLNYRYDNSVEYRIGYSVLGPFIYNFCLWIHKKKQELSIEKLYFVAREGFLIKQCYDEIFPEDITYYIRLNKNLLRYPSMRAHNITEQFLKSIPAINYISWREIIHYLDERNESYLLKSLKDEFPNVDIDEKIPFYKLDQEEKKALFDYLINHVKQEIELQKGLMLDYIQQQGLIGSRCCLINNSYQGSGQSMLRDILDDLHINTSLYGMQFIKSAKCEEQLGEYCVGWFNELGMDEDKIRTFYERSLLFEHLNFEPSGTALRLRRDPDGQVSVVCAQQRSEKYNNETIKKLQEASLQFVKDYISHIGIDFHTIAIDNYFWFLASPRKDDAIFCSSIWDDNDLDKDIQINSKNSDVNIKNVWYNYFPEELKWPVGFLVAYKPWYMYMLYKARRRYKRIKKMIKELVCNF